MAESSNWIDRRSAVETNLRVKSVEVWHAVRGALQDACHSFREHYETVETSILTDKVENCSRMMIDIFFKRIGSRRTVIVYFNPTLPAIEWTVENKVMISANETDVFAVDEDGKRISPDALSRRILEPLIFGDDSPYKPTFPSISSIDQ